MITLEVPRDFVTSSGTITWHKNHPQLAKLGRKHLQFCKQHCASWWPSTDIYIYIYMLLISMHWHRQAIVESKGDKLSSSAECRIRTHQCLRHQIASRLNARWQTDWAIGDQAKPELNSPSLWSASIQPTWPHCHLAFAPGSGDIHICC